MAQHDFAPAWLNFPTPPSSTKPFLYSDKHSEGLGRSDCAFNVNRQRHSSSDAFDSAIGRPHGGNLAKREKIAWRPQSRAGAEPTWQRDTSPHPYSMKSQLHSENNTSEIDLPRKVDREERKMFEVEDFVSLEKLCEMYINCNFSGTLSWSWTYPVSDRSRSSQMLGIKKGVKDDFSLSGYSIAAGNQSLPGKHWAGIKKEECKSLTKESSIGSSFYQDCPHEKYRPNTSLHAELLAVTPCSLEGEEDTNLNNRNGSCPERDINLNFDENKISEDNGNTLMSGQISSAYPPDGVLSSSLEAEFRLLREMGWQEDSENDETCAPLTEDEMKEFQAISEQLQKNGLRKHVFLRNALALDLFHDSVQKEDSETSSSSDTSDDE
uniref:Vasculin n=1 Tax=Xenopus tropicalis TaxID=8364 RepID=A0A6I8SNR4_XENTR